MNTKQLATIALVVLIVGVLTVLSILSFSTLTTRETGLMSTILTLLSILATWIVSFLYSESIHKDSISEAKESHQENLRTYALKASEKVTNLSDQLAQVCAFLEEELNISDFDTVQELVNSREQRIISAIQMLGMLRSVNDTSLSDWQGVIGEELEEQREEKKELQEHVLQLTDRLESLLERESTHTKNRAEESDAQLISLRNELSRMMNELSGRRPVPKIARKEVRKDVKLKCPNCKKELNYSQRSKRTSAKKVDCNHCKANYVSRYDENQGIFYLEIKRDLQEEIQCADCASTIQGTLNSYPGSSSNIECHKCGTKYRLARHHSGDVRVKILGVNSTKENVLTESVIEGVQLALPEQPWPKHIHKKVAKDLDISNGMAQRAIRILIQRGQCKEQINGELFDLRPVSVE